MPRLSCNLQGVHHKCISAADVSHAQSMHAPMRATSHASASTLVKTSVDAEGGAP